MAPSFISLTKPRRLSPHHHHYATTRTLIDISTINWVRDRALDHAVEKEHNLKPILNLKNLIKSQPSKSLPISIIAENRQSLEIPFRPIDFIRKYPAIFEQFLPGGIGADLVHPHIRLTAEVVDLDAEEILMYQGQSYRKQAADRLLKLLMLCRVNRIPLSVVEKLKWDLGLPQDYVESLVPEFPDYFQVVEDRKGVFGSNDKRVLELVCWSDDLAVSVLEKKAVKDDGYRKGMPIEFPLQYSRGFEVDKKFKKWVDEWQKLPYISPYENALHLTPTSDESDKWAVSVLHELIHILVPKKTEKENVLCIGEYLGLRSRFKRAMLHHPGVFYVSSKSNTHTVVLRDGYKRDLLIEKHVLMGMRSQYAHLMNALKENPKSKTAPGVDLKKKKAATQDSEGRVVEDEDDDVESREENEAAGHNSSEFEAEDTSDDEYDDDNEEEDSEDESNIRAPRKNSAVIGGGINNRKNYHVKNSSRNQEVDNDDESHTGARKNNADSDGRRNNRADSQMKSSRNQEVDSEDETHTGARKNNAVDRQSKPNRTNFEVNGSLRNHGKVNRPEKYTARTKPKSSSKFSNRSETNEPSRNHGKENRAERYTDRTKANVPSKFSNRNEMNENNGKEYRAERNDVKTKAKGPSNFSTRSEANDGKRAPMKFSERLNSQRSRGRSMPDKRSSAS